MEESAVYMYLLLYYISSARIARDFFSSFLFFFFHLTYSRWTSSLPSCLWSQRIFPSLPGSRLTIFYRDASSALLQLVNQRLNFTYSRSHAFRYERKNTNPTLVRIELTTSVLADVQLTYETTRATTMNTKVHTWYTIQDVYDTVAPATSQYAIVCKTQQYMYFCTIYQQYTHSSRPPMDATVCMYVHHIL